MPRTRRNIKTNVGESAIAQKTRTTYSRAALNKGNATISAKDKAKGVALCDALDRALEVGVVAQGHLTIVLADIPLIAIRLGVVIASVETLEQESMIP